MPDIDIDFADVSRNLIFDYMAETYGQDHVARLGTVAMYKAQSALNETAGALSVPRWEADKVMDSLMKRSSGDARAMEALGDALTDTAAGQKLLRDWPEMAVAARLENHPRHFSQHAAGVVLTALPTTEYMAVDLRTNATHCDKKDAEELDLLKIDCLGLVQLSVFQDALKMAGLPHDYLDSVPLDDQRVFDLLNRKQYAGIFQFNGPALQGVAKMIRFTELDDITAVTALARPGPLASGGTDTWLKRKAGTQPVTYPHPAFEPHLRDSYGVVIFQEQVMNIGREVGDLSWADVTQLRKAMSKSLGAEFFNQYGDRWKEGARKKGIAEGVLTKVWDDLCAYGSWSFNKAHAVAYGMVSYWCGWLKVHYPIEFAAATLQHEASPEQQINYLRELANEGIGYVPAHIDLSTDTWRVGEVEGKKQLIGPVQNVIGIGPKLVKSIMAARSRGEPLPERASKLLTNPRTALDSLWPIRDRFSVVLPDPTTRNIHSRPSTINEINNELTEAEVLFFCVFSKINTRDENEAVKIAKRGGELITDGKTTSLNLTMRDDTGMIFGKVGRFDYNALGAPIVEAGKPGKLLYAVKGRTWGDATFRGVKIKSVRFIGEME